MVLLSIDIFLNETDTDTNIVSWASAIPILILVSLAGPQRYRYRYLVSEAKVSVNDTDTDSIAHPCSCHEIWKILQQLNCKNAKFHTIQGIKITKEIGIKW